MLPAKIDFARRTTLCIISIAAVMVQLIWWLLPCCAQVAQPWPEADRLFHSDPRWLGGDGAFSVDLGKGRVLWLFGDSFIAKQPGQKRSACRMVRNSLAIEKGYDPSKASIKFYCQKQNGQAQSFFADRKEQWLWPLHGARLGKQLLLFYNVICADRLPGSLGFRGLGATALLIGNPDEEPSKWRRREITLPENNWKITLGVAVLQRDDDLYIYGFDEPKHDIYVARLPIALATNGDFSKLEWWTATRQWIAQSEMRLRPAPVFENGSTELSVHWEKATKRYVEVQSLGFGASNISMRSSKEITGPWSPLQAIYLPPESREPDPFVYAGKAHRELEGADLVATYAANGGEKRLAEDMSIYFPRFIRCSLSK